MSLEIVYQDADFIAVNKPSGLLVHPTKLDAHAAESVQARLAAQIGQRPLPCHRLDKPTSGVLLFALHPQALLQAQSQFAQTAAKKSYRALVRGWPPASGLVDTPLKKELPPYTIQSAHTHYTSLEYYDFPHPVGRYPSARLALLKLEPLTGRTHQLRRHLAHIRHPILGDTRHGDGAQNRFMRAQLASQHLLLHAQSLEIKLGASTTSVHIQAPMDAAFQACLEKLHPHRCGGPQKLPTR
jgi:tRNA pseudouridine65 synthase